MKIFKIERSSHILNSLVYRTVRKIYHDYLDMHKYVWQLHAIP